MAETNGNTVGKGRDSYGKFLNHLTSLPVVSAGMSTYSSSPLGARSIDMAASVYNQAKAHLLPPYQTYLSPYVERPYSYVQPYIYKADELGDSALNKITTRFPIVKEEPAVVQERVATTAKSTTNAVASNAFGAVRYGAATSVAAAVYPINKSAEGGRYVLRQYTQFFNETQGGLVMKLGRAAFLTPLQVTIDVVDGVQSYLHRLNKDTRATLAARKQQTKDTVHEKKQDVMDSNSVQ